MVAARMLLRAGWAHQGFTGPLPYALRAHALLQDFHSDNNRAFLDTLLTDQMVLCVLYQLITCNIWQGIKNIDGGLQQWCGGFFFFLFESQQLLSGTGTSSRNTVRAVMFPNLQMIKLLQVVRDKQHSEADACIQEERDSFQPHPPTMTLPACIPLWWHLQDLTAGLWSAATGSTVVP